MKRNIKEVDLYISSFATLAQLRLQSIRKMVLNINSEIEEYFSYKLPSYKFRKKPFVYFGAFKNHIGLYAISTNSVALQTKMSKYKCGAGSIQFPHNKTLPLKLIAEILQERLEQVL